MKKQLESFDYAVILLLRKFGDSFGRLAIFLIFFWFGFLKVLLISPAIPLVVDLLNVTFLNFIPSETFLIFFGGIEMIIGLLVLVPRWERIAFAALALHLMTTMMPLYFLRDITWSQSFVPTLTGQYIMKNIALLSISLLLFARLRPMTETHRILSR